MSSWIHRFKPSSWRDVFLLALASRLAWICLAVMFDLLVTDHVAQGVVELKSLDTLHWALRPFVKWDSAHLLNIAEGGYANEM